MGHPGALVRYYEIRSSEDRHDRLSDRTGQVLPCPVRQSCSSVSIARPVVGRTTLLEEVVHGLRGPEEI